MIAYIDSSLLTRAYLVNQDGHREAIRLLNGDTTLITGTWTRIEVSGALARAARNSGAKSDVLLNALDQDLDPISGSIREVRVPQDDIERLALRIVRAHVLRAMDAWHLACATLTLPSLAEAGEAFLFATRDAHQAQAARSLGLDVM